MGIKETEAGGAPNLAELEKQLAPSSYGEKEIIKIPVRHLVILSQVRNVPNPEAERLKESISANGLINQIDVARLEPQHFADYVNFVNAVWGDNFDPQSFPVAEDGYVYLVVAGHTRAEAIIAIEDEKATKRIELGLPQPFDEAAIFSKVHTNITPEQVIALQINENIHRQPPVERTAMAVVETYMYGLKTGKWSTKAEFVAKNERGLSRSTLNDALHFAELPSHIRDFVLTGSVPYRAGIELGRTLPVMRDFFRHKYFSGKDYETMTDEEEDELNNGLLEWLGAEVAHVQNARAEGRFSGNIIKNHYESIRGDHEALIAGMTGDASGAQQAFEMTETTDWSQSRRRRREEYKLLLRQLSARPLGRAATMVNLHLDLLARVNGGSGEESTAQTIVTHLETYVDKVRSSAAKQEPKGESFF